jgi:hypothetical protein
VNIFDSDGKTILDTIGLPAGVFLKLDFSNPNKPILPESAKLELLRWQAQADESNAALPETKANENADNC